MSLTASLALSVLILAGGESRRMGRDKALLSLGDRSFLAATVAIAQQLSPAIWVSTPWREAYRGIFGQGVQWLDDPQRAGGLVALAHFLQHCQGQVPPGWVLLLACDLPYLQTQQLQLWVDQLATIPDHYPVALVRSDGFYEPLCGFYRTTIRASLEQFLAGGDRSFQRWLRTEQVYHLPLTHPGMLFNCNTPEDFATLKADD